MKGIDIFKITMMVFIAILLIGCADVETVSDCLSDNTYGFWGGLWHGMIAPVSFIGSLFSDDIAMYAVNNTGKLYDLGFVLGSGILLGGLTKSLKK